MNSRVTRILSFVVALAGLAVLLATPGLSEGARHLILVQHGGSMDTNTLMAGVEAAVSSYRLIGGILLGVGLFRALQG